MCSGKCLWHRLHASQWGLLPPMPHTQAQGWQVYQAGLSWHPRAVKLVRPSTFHFAQNWSPRFMVELRELECSIVFFLNISNYVKREKHSQQPCLACLCHFEQWMKGPHLPAVQLHCCYDLWYWLLTKSCKEWSWGRLVRQVWNSSVCHQKHYSRADGWDSSPWNGCTLTWEE